MKKMDQLLEVIREENLNIYSVTEISDGQSVTVNLKDCELSDSPVCRNVYSVAKAFTMAAVGFLYDEGKIRLEDTIAQVLGALPTDLRAYDTDRRSLNAGMLLHFTTEAPQEQIALVKQYAALLRGDSISPAAIPTTSGHWTRGVE